MKLETLCSRLSVEHPCELICRQFSKISEMLPDCPSDEPLSKISDSCASDVPLLVTIILLVGVAIGLLITIIYLLLKQKLPHYYEEVALPVQKDKSLQAIMSFSSSYECLLRQADRTPTRRVIENSVPAKPERPRLANEGARGTSQFPRAFEAPVRAKRLREQQEDDYEPAIQSFPVKAEIHDPEKVGQVQLILCLLKYIDKKMSGLLL